MKTEKSNPSVKDEQADVKAENDVKAEAGGVKGELDCVISRIDYSKKIPDFSQLPLEVVKLELQNNGNRVCSLAKKKTQELITYVWQYRKHGEIPFKFLFEDEEDGDEAMGH